MDECDISIFLMPVLNGGEEHEHISGGNHQN